MCLTALNVNVNFNNVKHMMNVRCFTDQKSLVISDAFSLKYPRNMHIFMAKVCYGCSTIALDTAAKNLLIWLRVVDKVDIYFRLPPSLSIRDDVLGTHHCLLSLLQFLEPDNLPKCVCLHILSSNDGTFVFFGHILAF
jgi:hypothetical protein